MFTSRDYQEAAIGGSLSAFETSQTALGVMFTGGGKTYVAARVADARKHLGRILALAHRDELIKQLKNALEKVTGLHAEIEKADQYAHEGGMWKAEIIVASYPTLIAPMDGGRRMERFNPMEFATIIPDECHHAICPSQRMTLDYFLRNPEARCLGLTATPHRKDEVAMGNVFKAAEDHYFAAGESVA